MECIKVPNSNYAISLEAGKHKKRATIPKAKNKKANVLIINALANIVVIPMGLEPMTP